MDLENLANGEEGLTQNLLADDPLIVGKQRLDHLVVVRGDDGMGADGFQCGDFGVQFGRTVRAFRIRAKRREDEPPRESWRPVGLSQAATMED
jgi:hypothetical protein